jgi:hypothetical protein
MDHDNVKLKIGALVQSVNYRLSDFNRTVYMSFTKFILNKNKKVF